MSDVIAEHLSMFVDLYSNEHIRLRPKHHFLVHFATIVLKSGPLTGMCCMRYELKNSFFKRSAHVVCNFIINICRTLAYRHQQHALHSLLSNSHMRNVASVAGHTFVLAHSVAFCDVLVARFGIAQQLTTVTFNFCMSFLATRTAHSTVQSIHHYTSITPDFLKHQQHLNRNNHE